MTRRLLVTLELRPDDSKAICDTMGAIARAWFGVDWGCVAQVFV